MLTLSLFCERDKTQASGAAYRYFEAFVPVLVINMASAYTGKAVATFYHRCEAVFGKNDYWIVY